MRLRLLFSLLLFIPLIASAQVSEEEMKKANNPLANAKAINLQNYYIPTIYDDAGLRSNSFLLRYSQPFAKGKILLRVTQPVNTMPTGYTPGGFVTYASGLGDLNFFATYTFTKPDAKTLIGAGPQVVIPTGTNQALTAGRVQVGGAFIIFSSPTPALQLGGLITYQKDVGGQEDRGPAQVLIAQPFALFQLGKGAYLRSTALANFNIETEAYNVPIGIGIGHVAKSGKAVFNIFLEPQFTILHYGPGQPALQFFGGINTQF
ncbi:hypothetical protein ACWKWU_12170 [Chitinophaga lutea]